MDASRVHVLRDGAQYRYSVCSRQPVKGSRVAGGKMLRSRARTATIDESVAKKIKEHQSELVKQKQEEGLKRFKGEDGGGRDTNEEVFKKYESYRRESQLPTKVEDLRVRCAPRLT